MALLSPFFTRRLGGTLALLAVCLFAVSPARAQAPVPTEYDIKAVFIFNFTRFVAWPAPVVADEPVVIGVLGADPFGPRLDEVIRGEKAGSRPLIVKRYKTVDEVGECAVLFIAQSEAASLPQILNHLAGRPVLTVSDLPGFAETGGMVGLVMDQGKVRLHINVEASKLASLSISAKLLRPAQVVITRKTSRLMPQGRLQMFSLIFCRSRALLPRREPT